MVGTNQEDKLGPHVHGSTQLFLEVWQEPGNYVEAELQMMWSLF